MSRSEEPAGRSRIFTPEELGIVKTMAIDILSHPTNLPLGRNLPLGTVRPLPQSVKDLAHSRKAF